MDSSSSTSHGTEPWATEIDKPEELIALVGQALGTSPWITVTQADIDDFARITLDEQWIHTDPERAAAGPFGTTIAHGFLVLSLCSYFGTSTLTVRSSGMGINYGLDRVRFLSPVPVGARLRGRATLDSAEPLPDDGIHLVQTITVEVEGHEKPACVAAVVGRLYE